MPDHPEGTRFAIRVDEGRSGIVLTTTADSRVVHLEATERGIVTVDRHVDVAVLAAVIGGAAAKGFRRTLFEREWERADIDRLQPRGGPAVPSTPRRRRRGGSTGWELRIRYVGTPGRRKTETIALGGFVTDEEAVIAEGLRVLRMVEGRGSSGTSMAVVNAHSGKRLGTWRLSGRTSSPRTEWIAAEEPNGEVEEGQARGAPQGRREDGSDRPPKGE